VSSQAGPFGYAGWDVGSLDPPGGDVNRLGQRDIASQVHEPGVAVEAGMGDHDDIGTRCHHG
jgi:hypothetical protein